MGILATLVKRLTSGWSPATSGRSLENPSTSLADPDEWLYEAFGAARSLTGLRVGRENALTYSPWWRGITLVSADVAKVSLNVYKRLQRGKMIDSRHPAYRLLRYKANERQTAYQFRRQLTGHALAMGNGYAYILRDGGARPLELLPLDPDSTCTYPVIVDGRLWYVTTVNGEQRKLRAEDVLHAKGYSFDGLVGYSVVNKARDSLGLGLGAQAFASKGMANGARPSVVLESENVISGPARQTLRTEWREMHEGIDNVARTAILDRGLKANALSFSNEDAQLIQTREFNIRDIANWIGVPPHKLGDTSPTAYASLEQENQAYLDESLDHWLVTWEDECRDKLLTEDEKDQETHAISHARRTLRRANLLDRTAYYGSALQHGWLSRDEVRDEEDMNPIPEGEGQRYFVPLNLGLSGEHDEATIPGASFADVVGLVTDAVKEGVPADAVGVLIKAAYPSIPADQLARIIESLAIAQEEEPAAEETAEVAQGAEEQEPAEQEPTPEPTGDASRESDQAGEDERTRELRAGVRRSLTDTLWRMTRRVGLRAKRASKEPDTFLDALDQIEKEVRPVLVKALASAGDSVRGLGVSDVTGETLADDLLRYQREGLLAVSGECTVTTLAAGVEAFEKEAMEKYPSEVANRLLPEV